MYADWASSKRNRLRDGWKIMRICHSETVWCQHTQFDINLPYLCCLGGNRLGGKKLFLLHLKPFRVLHFYLSLMNYSIPCVNFSFWFRYPLIVIFITSSFIKSDPRDLKIQYKIYF